MWNWTAAWLAELGEGCSAEQEVVSSNPGQTNTQGLQITEKKVKWHCKRLFLFFCDVDDKP